MSERDLRDPTSGNSGILEDLIAEYLDRLNDGEALNPKAILAEHPGVGHQVVKALHEFVGFGADSDDNGNEPLGTLGDYTLRRQIGRGGMGVVYEAWENSMDRRVALKVLPAGVAADTSVSARFLREAQTAGKLSHPNVVPVYFTGVKEQTPFYAMEYVEGETLAQILGRIKGAEPEVETPFGVKDELDYFVKLARAFADVADGLQHAHSQGVIHRDIKPSNLILDSDGRLRILDFGLARLEGQESLTLSGDFVGTPQYMSPEQARRKKIPIDHRTNVYSLGATMYEAFCGRPPFRGKDHADTLSQIIERDPTQARRLNPRVPKDLETIVLKCLRKDASDRYGTAEALGQDLRRFVRGDPIEARPRSRLELWVRRLWLYRLRLSAGAVIASLVVLVVWFGLRELEVARKAAWERYEAGVHRAAMVAQLGKLAGGENAGPIRPVPFFDLEDLASVSSVEAHPLDAAAVELERIEEILPAQFEAPYHRARLLVLLGRKEEARAALRQSLSRRPGFVPARSLLAEIEGRETPELLAASERWSGHWIQAQRAFRERRWEDAVRSYTELIRIEDRRGELYLGSSIEIRLGRGVALFESGDSLGAGLDFATAAARWPRFREPSLFLAAACHRSGRRELARRVLEDLYERAASPDETAYWIVATSRVLGDYDEALRWADAIEREALREQVKSALLVFSLRFEEAVEAARKAIDARPSDPLSHALLSFALVFDSGNRGREGRERFRSEALAAATRACELRPEGGVVHAALAFALQENGEPDAANRVIQRALELEPGRFVSMYCAGGIAARQRRFSDAERILREAAEGARSRGLAHEEALCRTAVALTLRGRQRTKAAFEEYRRAIAAFPQSDAYSNLGHLYRWRIGDSEAAERMHREAIEITPHSSYRWVWLAEALNGHGKYGDALDAVAQALERTPDSPEALWVKGMTQEALGDPGAAVASYVEALKNGGSSKVQLLAARHLAAVLFQHAASGGDPRLDPLVELLDAVFVAGYERGDENATVLSAAAMALVRARRRRDLGRAGELAQRALEAAENHFSLAALASLEHARGEEAQAVRTLERAVADPRAPLHLQGVLDRWRSALAGATVSYATVDARGVDPSGAQATPPIDPEADAEEARAALYARARQLEEGGEVDEAERLLQRLARLDPGSSSPRLGISRCLVRQGNPAEAEESLRGWLLSERSEDREAWEWWIALSFTELSLSPAEVLARLGPQAVAEGDAPAEPRYLADLRWLLGRLRSRGEPGTWLGILAGSEGDRSLDGRPWSRDRFQLGGRSKGWEASADPDLTETEAIYERTRRFNPREGSELSTVGRPGLPHPAAAGPLPRHPLALGARLRRGGAGQDREAAEDPDRVRGAG